MAFATSMDIAIIGGGLAGITLALSLHSLGINATVFESRSSSVVTAGGLLLSPNALGILDKLGVYQRIRSKGFNFEKLTYKNDKHETVDQYAFGSEAQYGYKALRIYRQILLDELRVMVEEQDIEIIYGQKFSKVVSESDHDITFEFANGERVTTKILIGADSIHSSVRRTLVADVKANYIGLMAITCAIPAEKIHVLNTDHAPDAGLRYPLPVSLHEKKGAFVLAPQRADGSEIFAGIQYPYPEQTREGWEKLFADKEQLLSLMKAGYDDWSPLVQSAMDAVPLDTLGIWAFYTMPRLQSWASEKKRAVLVGDSAHAISPTAGQGAGQAFEDAYSLALLISMLDQKTNATERFEAWPRALVKWQRYRQERVDRVLASVGNPRSTFYSVLHAEQK